MAVCENGSTADEPSIQRRMERDMAIARVAVFLGAGILIGWWVHFIATSLGWQLGAVAASTSLIGGGVAYLHINDKS